MIIVLVGRSLPLLLDGRKRSAAVPPGVDIRHWLWSPFLTVEDTRVAVVEVHGVKGWAVGPFAQAIARMRGDVAEDVGADVPAAEGVEIPVGFDSGDLGVVVVVVGIGRADEVGGDGITEEKGEDLVLDAVVLVLVESDHHEGVVHKTFVVQEGFHEILEPFSCGGDVRVVAVAGHVWGDEHPLRELIGLKVLVEERGVLDLLETVLLVDHGGEENFGTVFMLVVSLLLVSAWNSLVLAHIIILSVLLIDPGKALEARVGQVFLVQ